jgi:hypothetical protein
VKPNINTVEVHPVDGALVVFEGLAQVLVVNQNPNTGVLD